jgi:hypothetical protein
MITEMEREEYLAEIRRQVCSHCTEKPEGAPPCAPLGKPCGVELYLPELVEAIHEVQGDQMEHYQRRKQSHICARCAYLHSYYCPCPLDTWFPPIIEAVKTVDRRHDRQARVHHFLAGLPAAADGDLRAITRAYEAAAGTWTGCDWPTNFGNQDLDLNGWTAAEAESMSVESTDPEEVEDWMAAARWLAKVEENAAQAEGQAALAVAAANVREWGEALEHARRAVLLEFASGRPLWHGMPLTWQPLWDAIKHTAAACCAPSGRSQAPPTRKETGS